MSSKAQIIKQLKKQNKELLNKVGNQRDAILRLEARLYEVKRKNFVNLEGFTSDVEAICKIFEKEMAWQSLSPNPNAQLKKLKSMTRTIRIKVDNLNDHFMNNNLDDPLISLYYERKMQRKYK